VKAIFANDMEKGPGYGVLKVSQTRLVLPLADCRFTVLRSCDQQCLIPGGWQNAEKPLVAAAMSQEGDTLSLFVGPDVVDQLDTLEVYRLTVIAPDESRDAGILELGDVRYSPRRGANRLSEIPDTEGISPPPPVETPPVTATEAQPVVETRAVVETPPVDAGRALGAEGSVKPPRPRWPLLLAGMLLLLGLGVGVWLYLQPHSPPPATAVNPPATAGVDKPDGGKSEVDREKGKETPVASERSPLETARAFLHDKGPGDKALELSRTMPQTPDGRDGAFLLLGYAAESGLGEAMTDLARFYDPTDTAPTGSIRKDAEQAWRWYAKAKAAGQAGTEERLDVLGAWLRQEADKGDATARELLGRLR
jgi:hypothetical protein